ncbi:MAG: agmatinase [Candidatus Omnitrophota bacterium]
MLNKNYNADIKFCGMEGALSTWAKAGIAVLPVSYDMTTSYKPGASFGPQAIIDASRYMETYDEETGKEAYKSGIYTCEEIKETSPDPGKVIKIVEDAIGVILRARKFPVMLGGEHSITLGAVRACNKRFKDLSVLQLDAHRDLRDSFHGSKYNHACIASRVMDITGLTQVGIRSLSKEEALKRRKGLNTFFMKDMEEDDNWIEGVIDSIRAKNVYVTIDLDVFDPSIVPSVGTPEPGGMGWREVLRLLRRISEERDVVGFDVVELAPMQGNVAPDFLAARLVYKFLNYIF